MFSKVLKMRKSLSLLAALLISAAQAHAQTATPVNPGYDALTGPNCATSPCHLAFGIVTPGVGGPAVASKVLLAKPGSLLGVYFTAQGTQGWGMVFNSATDPADGATTVGTAAGNLEECIYVPASTTQAISFQGLPVETYSAGITAVFSSTGCGTKTESATAFIHGLAQ